MIFNGNETAQTVFNQMVEIPEGVVELRDDRTKEKWSVEIHSFLLSKFQVTQKLYYTIINENPSSFIGDCLPVETISFKEAVIFCNTLSIQSNLRPCYSFSDENQEIMHDNSADGFRLPTEAEWEYACRAGSRGVRYNSIDSIAWYKGNSEKMTHEVGQLKANAWGLFDMLGNVWEWCSDVYDSDVYGSYRIFRGGGFCDLERSVMATTRRRSHPLKFKIDDLGFRLAKNK